MYLSVHLPFLPLSFLSLIAIHPAPIFASAPSSSAILAPIILPGDQHTIPSSPESRVHEFTLRHIFHHGTHKYPGLHRRLNITEKASVKVLDENENTKRPAPRLRARSETHRIQRLADRRQENIDHILDSGRMRGEPMVLDASAWTIDDVPGPNITDKETVLSIARMAADAYVVDDDDGEWQDVGNGFNYTEDFGWKLDGLRGHIFADTENQTVVIAVKGTSPAVFDGSGTTTNDKVNDNLFFSCCCGQGGRFGWLQVCDCQTTAYTCNSTCVVEALKVKNRYYYAAQEIYRNVTEIYPNADIWLAGHSLGGSTNSLVALTYGLPVVTFEAPGEAMPAKRLGLPTPPGYHLGAHQQRASTGGYHFGHTADPIFMGTCNTYSSVCTIAGYAMQSVCHTGLTCTYDTVGDLGWRSGAGTHRIASVIKDVLEKYPEAATCEPMVECSDCYNWEYFDSNHSTTTTTSSSSSTTTTATRTSTCKTPGWWGCLDESTSSKSTTTTTTTTTTVTTTETTTTDTTTTCLTPGWFGCKDETSTTSSTTTPPTAPITSHDGHHKHETTTTSTTCQTPGWFGCNDPTSSSSTKQTMPITSPATTPPGLPMPTATTSAPPKSTCARRSWYGRCVEWDEVVNWKEDL